MKVERTLKFFIEGVGVLGPGLPHWQATVPLLTHPENYSEAAVQVPPPDCLPPAERRRVGTQVKLALATGREAVAQSQRDATILSNVFSASSGESDNCHAICETLADDERLISPTRFHNSVHNAAAGYWGIAMKCMAPSTSLGAHDGSFAAGLLEVAMQVNSDQQAAILIASDAPYPEPLHHKRSLSHPFGVALVVAAEPGQRTLASVYMTFTQEEATKMQWPTFEALRTSNPAARSLPLLQAMTHAASTSFCLPYLDRCNIQVTLTTEFGALS